ncbi:putative type III secretion apparatus [Trichinella spiralis]|uniref:putative type III secretion apparatus n=1 Tax=Trichinella spiralis TaxID=6334 RepID=UPI0001EFEBA0|nr:putative type III secretion apparatus [Trichinella spiralis]
MANPVLYGLRDTSSAGDGTTERSGYRTDMPVGGYKDTSRKMPDWKQQDAAESITTKRSADGTFYPPDHACNDYFWQTLLLATGEYPVEIMFQQVCENADLSFE